MLSPEYYESCADLVVKQYTELENAIVRDIIRRMMKTGMVTESTKWQAEMLQEAGLLYNDVVQSIADRMDACAEQVKTLFEDAGVKTVEIDNEVYRAAGKVPIDIRLSPSMRQVLEAGYRKTLGLLDNLTSTMPSAGQQIYINACNHAYMKVTSGAFSYQEAVKQAVCDVAASGLKIIRYDSGHTDRIDVAVRRAVLTGVGQTCREIGKMNAEENGCDLMEISAHAGARPEHAVWQGQLVDLTGRRVGEIIDGKRVLSLADIGYGLITGFGGVNCRHDWYPYFEGYSVPLYTEEYLKKLNARDIEYDSEKHTLYEMTQMQRKGERKIRDLKRRCITYEEAVKNAPDDSIKAAMQKKYQDSAVKLKAAEQNLKDFCATIGQDRDKFREQVLGFGRSQAQKAIWANKKDSLINWLTTVDEDGKINIDNFKNALSKGYVNTTIEQSQQQKHQSCKAWRNQVKQAIQSNGKQTPKSRLFDSINPQEIVDKYGGTGEFLVKKNNKCLNEYITLPCEVGKTFDKSSGKYVSTNRVQIKYTKGGTHVFPVKEKGE